METRECRNQFPILDVKEQETELLQMFSTTPLVSQFYDDRSLELIN